MEAQPESIRPENVRPQNPRPQNPRPQNLAVAASVVEHLMATPLFGALRAETLRPLADATRMHTYERGAVLFSEGDRPSVVHVLVSGLLRVFVTSFDGTEPTLATLSEGTIVGELGVLGDIPRSASVGALRKARVLTIPADAFRAAYTSDPALARRLVELLSERLRSTSGSMADLMYLDLGGRLAKYLLNEARRGGTDVVTLNFTQGELAQMIGGARQTVNQLLQSLELARLISVQGREIRVLDVAGLQMRALSAH